MNVHIRQVFLCVFFFQAEDGIRDLVRSRGLGDVYKRQGYRSQRLGRRAQRLIYGINDWATGRNDCAARPNDCLLYTSDAADERSSVDLGGRRIIKKKKQVDMGVAVGRDKNKKK